MRETIFDIETNGLLKQEGNKPAMTTIHCIGLCDGDEPVRSYRNVSEVLSHLEDADILVGHNIMKFDIPAIQKVYPTFKLSPKTVVRDTLVISRLIWSEIIEQDFAMLRKNPYAIPKNLLGRHSLEAWGYRIGVRKAEYKGGWEKWSPEMQAYCEQDIETTRKFWRVIKSKQYAAEAIQLEHDFQACIIDQERHGFPFDEKAAQEFFSELAAKRAELERQLRPYFPSWEETEVFTPKVNNRTRGYVKGVPFTKRWEIEFNPRSADHIVARLKVQRGWEPTMFTDTNKPKLDGEILEALGKQWPECAILAEHHEINKIIGMLAEGKQAWLKLVRNGRIYGEVITNGAVTGRCSHVRPNLGQIPKEGELGLRCRQLFTALPGSKLVGADASGLELRMLAHYMGRFDGGAYAKVVTEGDVHTVNQEAAGLPTRANAKTFIYGFLYGAGNEKIGRIVEKDAKEGSRLKAKFLKGLPALAALRDGVQEAAKQRGYLIGLDGRVLHIRAVYSALNTLLQSAGAIVVKRATVIFHKHLVELNLKDKAQMVVHVHDEAQFVVQEGYEKQIGELFVQSIREAGEYFKLRCSLDGEHKSGDNWKHTH